MFQKFMFQMLMNCLAAASPTIVEGIRRAVAEMVVKAALTPNPWDDMFASLLQMLVGRPAEPVETPAGPDDERLS